MKLTILGAGTCVSGFPGVLDQYPPAFVLEIKNEKLLFECSEGVRFRLNKAGFEYSQMKDLFLTHAHPDHCALIQFIQSIHVKGDRDKNFVLDKLNIYCPKQIKDDFRKLWDFHFRGREIYKKIPKLNFVVMGDKTKKKFKAFKVITRKMWHALGKADIIGFRVKSKEGIFVYSGESKKIKNLVELAKDADLFLCECSANIGDVNCEWGHLTPFEAGEIAKEAGVKKIILTHYFGLDSDKKMIKDCRKSKFKGEIIIAKDFMVIEK